LCGDIRIAAIAKSYRRVRIADRLSHPRRKNSPQCGPYSATHDPGKLVLENMAMFRQSFWRDWVCGGMLIGFGFMLSDPGMPLEGRPGLFVMGAGAMVFLLAAVHGVASVVSAIVTPPAKISPPRPEPFPPNASGRGESEHSSSPFRSNH
jgi:hypothetical protein